MCNCMEVIDKKLAEADANTKISRTYTLSASMGMFPTIATEKADKSIRKKPMAIMPSFCPWCGLSYKTGLPGKTAALAQQPRADGGEAVAVIGLSDDGYKIGYLVPLRAHRLPIGTRLYTRPAPDDVAAGNELLRLGYSWSKAEGWEAPANSSVARLKAAMPPAWISEQVGGEFDDLTGGQGYRKGWNDCRKAWLIADQQEGES